MCEACQWYIGYPTAELFFESEFPEKYKLKKYYPDVRMGEDTKQRARAELDRIKRADCFQAEKMFDRWTLRLRVPNPMAGHGYYMFYEPPKADELS